MTASDLTEYVRKALSVVSFEDFQRHALSYLRSVNADEQRLASCSGWEEASVFYNYVMSVVSSLSRDDATLLGRTTDALAAMCFPASGARSALFAAKNIEYLRRYIYKMNSCATLRG